jgi:two-component system OmpR family response regulator
VVEDEPALAYFVECFLVMEGFEVRKAANRAEVIAAIRKGVPDVVLLDGTLPDVDGFQVLRSLRQNPMLRDVPTLMMTGRATREAVLDALSSGADGYLTKPLDAEMLITAVRAVVGLPDQPIDGSGAVDPWVNRDGLSKRGEVAHH